MIQQTDDSLSWGDVWSVPSAAEGFDAVLNVGWPIKDHDLPGIEYKLKYFEDVDPFPCDDIWERVLWIDDKIEGDRRVYVRCREGNSRSVSTVIAYLHHQGMDFEDACALLIRIKPHTTIGGGYTDDPLLIREWFRRDWLEFAERRRRDDESSEGKQE
jgi:protein-tyrosine phosphatase